MFATSRAGERFSRRVAGCPEAGIASRGVARLGQDHAPGGQHPVNRIGCQIGGIHQPRHRDGNRRVAHDQHVDRVRRCPVGAPDPAYDLDQFALGRVPAHRLGDRVRVSIGSRGGPCAVRPSRAPLAPRIQPQAARSPRRSSPRPAAPSPLGRWRGAADHDQRRRLAPFVSAGDGVVVRRGEVRGQVPPLDQPGLGLGL